MQDWPHQTRQRERVRRAIDDQEWVTIAAPPGAGKSRVMQEEARSLAARGGRVDVITHRRVLTGQMIRTFNDAGINFDVEASEWSDRRLRRFARYMPGADVRICQLQTVASRFFEKGVREVDAVFVDEQHQQCNDQGRKILVGSDGHKGYRHYNCAVVGFTATPVGMEGFTNEIHNSVSYAGLRKCGAHCLVKTFAPEFPDLARVNRMKTSSSGEWSSKSVARVMNPHIIAGNVFDNWELRNPNHLPTVLWGPDSKGAKAFAKEFQSKGIPAASLTDDGIFICKPGKSIKRFDGTDDARADLFSSVEEGDIKVLTNRFILREAWDAPWLYCGILATMFGGISTYLQTVGRLQRNCDKYDEKILLDHGGNYFRHGSFQTGRKWEMGDTNKKLQAKEKERRKRTQGTEVEPKCCSKCNQMRLSGPSCPHCGHAQKRSVRKVRQLDGTLKPVQGRAQNYVPDASDRPDWYWFEQALWACSNAQKSDKRPRSLHQVYRAACHKKKQNTGNALVKYSNLKGRYPHLPPWGTYHWQKSAGDYFPRMFGEKK